MVNKFVFNQKLITYFLFSPKAVPCIIEPFVHNYVRQLSEHIDPSYFYANDRKRINPNGCCSSCYQVCIDDWRMKRFITIKILELPNVNLDLLEVETQENQNSTEVKKNKLKHCCVSYFVWILFCVAFLIYYF